jgi:hypothetical protein
MNPEITVPFSPNQPESSYSELRLPNEPLNRRDTSSKPRTAQFRSFSLQNPKDLLFGKTFSSYVF